MDAILDVGMRQESEATINEGVECAEENFTCSFVSILLWGHRVAGVWIVHRAMRNFNNVNRVGQGVKKILVIFSVVCCCSPYLWVLCFLFASSITHEGRSTNE